MIKRALACSRRSSARASSDYLASMTRPDRLRGGNRSGLSCLRAAQGPMRSRRVRVASSSAGLLPVRFRLLSLDSNRFDSKLGLALPLNGCLSVQPSAHFDRHGERFNVFAGGVYGEACAPSSHHARRRGKWHGAMSARSYGDAHHAAGAARGGASSSRRFWDPRILQAFRSRPRKRPSAVLSRNRSQARGRWFSRMRARVLPPRGRGAPRAPAWADAHYGVGSSLP